MVSIAGLKNLLVIAASCAIAAAAAAQGASTPSAPASTPGGSGPNPIVSARGADKPTNDFKPGQPHHSRAISPELAAQLSAAAPKYTPPPPQPPPTPEEDQPDLRDVDKPNNRIIRLPKYVVTQPRPAVLSERAVNTQKGLADLAMKRYFTEGYKALNPFGLPLFGSPESLALGMYEEDERLKNMADLSEDARLVGSTDSAQGRYVKRLTNETYARPGDFDWKPIGR